MIDFHRLKMHHKQQYEDILFSRPSLGCEYSFANKFLWGQQRVAFLQGCVAFFSHYDGRSVYPYPMGDGDRRAVLEAILHDAKTRGIPCRITGMNEENRRELENFFPDRFAIRVDRDFFDYVYAIDDLADLKGKKFQKKRNHFNRFRSEHPEYEVRELNRCNLRQAMGMVDDWYRHRLQTDPQGNYLLENIALGRAFQHYEDLGMEGIMLLDRGRVLAVTMGSRLSPDTFDIHFEKAREDADGAYNAVNCEFARFLRLKYPEVRFLNREDDMGLEGLRKAKLSYNPHHMEEKYWACLKEDIYEE